MLALWFPNDVPRCMRAPLHRNLKGSHRIICLFLLFFMLVLSFLRIFSTWEEFSDTQLRSRYQVVQFQLYVALHASPLDCIFAKCYLCKAGFLVDAITKPKKRETGNEMQLSRYKKLCSAPKAYCDYTINYIFLSIYVYSFFRVTRLLRRTQVVWTQLPNKQKC